MMMMMTNKLVCQVSALEIQVLHGLLVRITDLRSKEVFSVEKPTFKN